MENNLVVPVPNVKVPLPSVQEVLASAKLPDLDLPLFVIVVVGFISFFVFKAILKSVIKGFLYSVILAMLLFFAGMVYFLGLDKAFLLLRAIFKI